MHRSAMIVAAVVMAAAGAGCDGCRCDGGGKPSREVKSHLKTPDEATFEKLVRDALPKRLDVAKQICGIAVGGLRDLEVKLKPGFLDLPGFRTAELRAKPVPGDAGSVPEALVCIAILRLMATPITDDAGDVKDWKLSNVSVEEVLTPGHEWKRPSSGGGGD